MRDHTESVELYFDPKEVSYKQLLEVFWNDHTPTSSRSVQYCSAIWYHSEEQKALAEQTKAEQQKKYKKPVTTRIEPTGTFTRAEEYHQRYLFGKGF
mmetsp:Transcript_17189/g.66905  ORF Transcript_17189/g.66905 Transcript_17189/m.66905 type:complete len:97 (-) Transcript_17189:234-524(-)